MLDIDLDDVVIPDDSTSDVGEEDVTDTEGDAAGEETEAKLQSMRGQLQQMEHHMQRVRQQMAQIEAGEDGVALVMGEGIDAITAISGDTLGNTQTAATPKRASPARGVRRGTKTMPASL